MGTWYDLFTRIISESLPEGLKPLAPLFLVFAFVFATLLGAMPFVVLWINRQVAAMRRVLAATEEKMDRMVQRHVEMMSLVKESSALVAERLSGAPPVVRFGPDDTTPNKMGAPEGAENTPEGKGAYNYCPGCKEIKFIKFFRCQTCGFHVQK